MPPWPLAEVLVIFLNVSSSVKLSTLTYTCQERKKSLSGKAIHRELESSDLINVNNKTIYMHRYIFISVYMGGWQK